MDELRTYLTILGWKPDVDYGGQLHYVSPDADLQVTLDKTGWSLGKFTDGDIDGVATGRYEETESGATLRELRVALGYAAHNAETLI